MTTDDAIVHWSLGELDPAEHEGVRRRVQRDAEAALEAAGVPTKIVSTVVEIETIIEFTKFAPKPFSAKALT